MEFEYFKKLTSSELSIYREWYVGKYIGDFDKPLNYKKTLDFIDSLLRPTT